MVIDTSILIEHYRARDKRKTAFWSIPDDMPLHISVVTLYELSMGAITAAQHQHITLLLKDMNILPLTEAVAKEAARIYQTLRKRNQMIDHRDIFIAATAKVHGLKLKTVNKKHFVRVPDLEVV